MCGGYKYSNRHSAAEITLHSLRTIKGNWLKWNFNNVMLFSIFAWDNFFYQMIGLTSVGEVTFSHQSNDEVVLEHVS